MTLSRPSGSPPAASGKGVVPMDYIVKILLLVFGGMTVVQLSPLKIDPWKWLGQQIGKAINGEVLANLDRLEKRMDKMEAQEESDKMESARIRILRFGDECKRNIKHGEEHFNQVLEDIDKYETYCATHPDFKNAKAVLTIARIKECYAERLEKGDFL